MRERKSFINLHKKNILYISAFLIAFLFVLLMPKSVSADFLHHEDKFRDSTVRWGIDVSEFQGDNIDWTALKNDGYDFVFVRVAGRGSGSGVFYQDKRWRNNITGAYNSGLKVGVYFFSQAVNPVEAAEEANYTADLVKDYRNMITLPMVIDFEYVNNSGRLYDARLSKDLATDVIQMFCEAANQRGFAGGVYSSYDFLMNKFDGPSVGKNHPVWMAWWTTDPSYEGNYDFWQYSSEGKVPGISGNVDCDIWYDKGQKYGNPTVDGGRITGWRQGYSGRWYYFDSDGSGVVNAWKQINGQWYYFAGTGEMVVNAWVGDYYVGSDGVMVTNRKVGQYYVGSDGKWIPNYGSIVEGWKQNGIGWWWQDADGGYPANCWRFINGSWYYFNGAGYMVTGWQYINGAWYYLSGSGAMLTGWQYINGVWYYLTGSGAMATGWQYINGVWYYLTGSGAMATGWQYINGVWYYLTGSGAMATGWQYINGNWYYMYGGGAMASNTWIGNYWVNASGAWA